MCWRGGQSSDCKVNSYLKQAKGELHGKHSCPDFRLNILLVKWLSGAFSVHSGQSAGVRPKTCQQSYSVFG